MRKISADKVFDGYKFIDNAIICIDDNGKIIDFLSSNEEIEEVEYHEGILSPGFINTHCHLELSHMKGIVAEGKGLVQFIKELQSQRVADADKIQQAIFDADLEMYNNGIVAVGDISNGIDSIQVKSKSNILYYTFIELYGFLDEVAQTSFDNGLQVSTTFKNNNLKFSIVPHSPYAVSASLLNLISSNTNADDIIAMHNQETVDENLLFIKGKGSFIDLMQWFGLDTSFWKPTQKSSLTSVAHLLPKNNNLLLVHNTFSTKEDIELINRLNDSVYWVFCPNANKYIEQVLPSFNQFIAINQKCTIGTDSLTSNWSLSILDEINTIRNSDKTIPIETLLKWATINGANALNIGQKLGSIEKGKTPGINLISTDFKSVKKLV